MSSIIYLDTSALVKSYLRESGSSQVISLLRSAEITGTSILTKVETAAALSKAARMGLVSSAGARTAWESFLAQWPSLIRLDILEQTCDRAATIAWEHGLRGYDAMHLATALSWQELLGAPVTLASFDRSLWTAALNAGLVIWPNETGCIA